MRDLLAARAISALDCDRLDLEWLAGDGGVTAEFGDRQMIWRQSWDGRPCGDPVLFVGATRAGALDLEVAP